MEPIFIRPDIFVTLLKKMASIMKTKEEIDQVNGRLK